MKPRLKRSAAASAATAMQKACCAYGGRGRCDCKFGVLDAVERGGRPHSGEVGNGCPELREIAIVLSGMTEKEYAAAYKKGLRRMITTKQKGVTT